MPGDRGTGDQVQPSPLEDLRVALDGAASVVADVAGNRWDRPSPCAGWSARDVLDHPVAGQLFFADVLHGAPRTVSRDLVRQAPGAAYLDSSRRMLGAFGEPGALQRPVQLPIGTVPGAVAVHLRVVEALVHGWDIARATGLAPRGDDEVADRALHFTGDDAGGMPQEHRPFGAPVPVADDRTALDRLAACLGRDIGAGAPPEGP